MGTNIVDLVTLTFMFDPLIKKNYVGYNFQMVCTTMLIFHMSVLCDNIFSCVPNILTLWPLCLTYLLKTLTLPVTFKWYVHCTRMLIFHMSLSCNKIFSWVPNFFDLVTLTLMFDPLIKNLTLAITFKWYVLECWYFTWVFLVTRFFHGYQHFWPCDLDLDVWRS
jgi:hypothetical protein